MALQHAMRLPYLLSSSTQNKFLVPISLTCLDPPHSQGHQATAIRTKGEVTRLYASKTVHKVGFNEGKGDSNEGEPNKKDPYLMDSEERREWREKIRQVLDKNRDVEEELDPTERNKKLQELLANYPLVVEEDDPEWSDDADGRGFKLDQFFDKISIKNTPSKDENDDDDDTDNQLVWQDDNYIRPIKDVTTAEWEETVFKDISPLIVLVHNRYKSVLQLMLLPSMSWSLLSKCVFPEIMFTKAGKILYREKAIRSGDELSKIMAFFYYGAAKPPCLNGIRDGQEEIPSVPINAQP